MYLSIGNQNSAWYHRNIEGSNYITYILSLILIPLDQAPVYNAHIFNFRGRQDRYRISEIT